MAAPSSWRTLREFLRWLVPAPRRLRGRRRSPRLY